MDFIDLLLEEHLEHSLVLARQHLCLHLIGSASPHILAVLPTSELKIKTIKHW